MSDAPVTIAPWESDAPKGCRMPSMMSAPEADLYQKMRTLHCANDRPSHTCAGRVTLDRNGMTLACPLCGDSQSVYPKDVGGNP